MSVFPEQRYRCDKCSVEINIPMEAGVARTPPDGWMMISIGIDPSKPARHFCPRCADLFVNFVGATL